MPEPSLFDDGPFTPCPAPFNMAAHTFAAASRTPAKIALEVLAAPARSPNAGPTPPSPRPCAAPPAVSPPAGIGRGDRVLLRLGNSADFPILFFAANALGAVPVPTSAQLTTAELGPILADLAPALICLGARPRPAGPAGRAGDRPAGDRGAPRP